MPKRKENNKTRWVNPYQYAKLTDNNPTTITNYINREKLGGTKASFNWTKDPNKSGRYLIEYVPDVEEKGKETQLKLLKDIASLEGKIQIEKLRKLEIENRKNEGLYLDKQKFNKDFFILLRSARDKFQSLPRKWRIKKDKLSLHEFEIECMKDINKILTELASFEYYDKDNHTN